MRNIAVTAGLMLTVCAMGAELPVCEEFAGEENISCVRSGDMAVISSLTPTGRSIEFFKGDRKGYMEISNDGSVLASSGIRLLSVERIPSEDTERYLSELMDSIVEDIGFGCERK